MPSLKLHKSNKLSQLTQLRKTQGLVGNIHADVLQTVKGTLSRTFFGFFSKTVPKLRLSTFNYAGNAPRT